MMTTAKRGLAGGLGLLLLLVYPGLVEAQFDVRQVPGQQGQRPFFAPKRAQGQFNQQNNGANPFANQNVYAGANPYAPFTAPADSGLENLYTPNTTLPSPYPYVPPFGYGWGNQFAGPGGFLHGASTFLYGYGDAIESQERARITREQALQARLRTKKMEFDLNRYMRENTPTFTEQQAKIAKNRLQRIRKYASLGEIYSGRALNVLLNDLRQHPNSKVSADTIPLSGQVLEHLNVTGSVGNLGLFRNVDNMKWPTALREMMQPMDIKRIETMAEAAVKQAKKGGQVDANILKDLRVSIDHARENLSDKVNQIPTREYIEAKRFLNAFDSARVALDRGDAKLFFKFQNFVSDGKNVRDVINFMIDNGLQFAPANDGDQFAYQALHSAMAAYDIALNTRLGS